MTSDDSDRSYSVFYDPEGNPITLTKEQEYCIDKENIAVKGAAGSGKSLVILAKARKYLANYSPDIKNCVAIFGFNNTFIEGTKQLLGYKAEQRNYISIKSLDSHLYDLFRLISNNKKPIISDASRKLLVRNAIEATKGSRFNTSEEHLAFAESEIKWMYGRGYWADNPGEDLEAYLENGRKGRGNVTLKQPDGTFKRVRLNESHKKEMFSIFLEFDRQLRRNYVDFEWMYGWLAKNMDLIPAEYKFEHVLVDEAQDQTLVKMTIAANLYTKEFVLAMDTNQKIYDNYWQFKDLGLKFRPLVRVLDEAFRNTIEIDALAEDIRIRNLDYLDDEHIKQPHKKPKRSGSKPWMIRCSSLDDEVKTAVSLAVELQRIIEKSPNSGTTAILYPWTKTYLQPLREELAAYDNGRGVPYQLIEKGSTFNVAEPGIKLCSIYGSKGLGFHNVIIVGFDNQKIPFNPNNVEFNQLDDAVKSKGCSLAYVAVTRPYLHLVMMFSKKPSHFLEELDGDLYDMKKSHYGQTLKQSIEKHDGMKLDNGYVLLERLRDVGLKVTVIQDHIWVLYEDYAAKVIANLNVKGTKFTLISMGPQVFNGAKSWRSDFTI